MLINLLWQAALMAVVLWWMYFLSNYVIRAVEQLLRKQDDDFLGSTYPVFSKGEIRDTYNRAVTASRKYPELQESVVMEPKFKEAAARHSIPKEELQRMRTVTEEIVEAERNWYRHSCMMDANMAVLSGKLPRDEALAAALERLKLADSFTTCMDGVTMLDQWKDRLEQRSTRDPAPRPYATPWSQRR